MMKEKEESLPLLFNTHRDAAIVSVVKTNLSACEIVSVEGKLMVAKTVISGCRQTLVSAFVPQNVLSSRDRTI